MLAYKLQACVEKMSAKVMLLYNMQQKNNLNPAKPEPSNNW